nr:fluoride efflux transporter CrcB [Deinobacterium chartae]
MLGGALGAAARHLLNEGVQRLTQATPLAGFPFATLLINVSGSMLLAFVATLQLQGGLSPRWRNWIGTGFLGAYTTFSTFSLEAHALLGRGEWGKAAAYMLGNLLLGLLGVVAGRALALAVTR